MGKNQAYKAMQRSRLGSSDAPGDTLDDGMADGSFHSPEWHAARLASLSKTHTLTWEELRKKQKEDELKRGEVEADKDKMMQEYRAQLDAERAKKLAHGRNQSSSKSSSNKGKLTGSVRMTRKNEKRGESIEVHGNQVIAPQNLQAVMMRAGTGENLDLGPDRRERRRKRSTGQGPSMPTAIERMKEALCGSLNFLGMGRPRAGNYSVFLFLPLLKWT